MRRPVFMVLLALALYVVPTQAQECIKLCGCYSLMDEGHRSCDEDRTCHVTYCSDSTGEGSYCWSGSDNWIDVCSDYDWFGCSYPELHDCLDDCVPIL